MLHSAGFPGGITVAWKGSKSFHVEFNLVAIPIVVDVTLISGQRVSLESDLTASAQSLAGRARRALGVGRGRLFSSSGTVLDGDAQLGAAKLRALQTGACLTLQVGTGRIGGGGFIFSRPSWEMGLSSHGAVGTVVVTQFCARPAEGCATDPSLPFWGFCRHPWR